MCHVPCGPWTRGSWRLCAHTFVHISSWRNFATGLMYLHHRLMFTEMQPHSAVLPLWFICQKSKFTPSCFATLESKMVGPVVPQFLNKVLVSLKQHVFFSTLGKSDSQARITRSSDLLIKLRERLGMPWRQTMEALGCFCGIRSSRHWEINFSWTAPHTHAP